MAYVDICIVGSGFGGAISAARLARYFRESGSGRTVRVLEKGNDWSGRFDPDSLGGELNAQGNRFKQSLKLDYYSQIVNTHTDVDGWRDGAPTCSVVSGKGVGGGSNVYLGIKLRAHTETFELMRDGRRLWPSIYSRESLAPQYDRCEETFRVHPIHWTDQDAPHWQLATKRDYVFAEGCAAIGATAVPLKAASVNDANEGWWSQGQRFEGRQNLTLNYLREAQEYGAEICSNCEVESIHPDGNGYTVEYTDHRYGGDSVSLDCKILIIAAGAVGSTGLLMKSADEFRSARQLNEDHLGKHLSANGDYGVVGIVGERYSVEGHKGKPMAVFTPSFWKEHKFLIIPFFAPAMPMAFGQPASLVMPEDPDAVGRWSTSARRGPDGVPERQWGQSYKDTLKQFGSRIMTMAAVGLDECEGEVTVGFNGKVGVKWEETNPDTTERYWNVAIQKMREIYRALDGELFLDAYRDKGHVIITHPLGGCRMAEDARDGVVTPSGEVWNNRNLFVIDGSVIPSALGVHPSLTISAVAESIWDRILSGDEESIEDRLAV